jgi:CubicO group peptidase (beta-lactamase class C family)
MWILAIILATALVACGSRSSTSSEASPAPPPAVVESAPTAYAIANAVDPIIRCALTDEGIPGAAFVFVHEDQVVYAQGYGVADQERRVAVDIERTVWPIASVTKLFTGVAALQLVDSGDLAMDQDINRYLRQLAVPAQGYPSITLAHLLSHTPAAMLILEQDFEIAVRADGVLELWGQEWLPLERDLFVRADGERLLGFARDNVDHVAVVSGGSWRVADRLAETPP